MFGFFRRKTKPPAPTWKGPRSVSWVIGDIAECITDSWNLTNIPIGDNLPKIGNRYLVKDVKVGESSDGTSILFFLTLVGLPLSYSVEGFRKIVLDDNKLDRKADCEITKQEPVLMED